MSKQEPIPNQQYTLRELQAFAVAEMYKSIPEHDDKEDPKVGAVLVDKDYRFICAAHRGELRSGDHAEFTALERKCRNQKLDNCIVFATLEPCAPGARKTPKLSCSERITNARISKVYIGVQDPDPTVAGKGETYLKSKGVEIEYFDKDFQEKIMLANELFMQQAQERALKANLEELQPVRSPMEIALPHFELKDFSEDALQLYIDKAGIDYKIGSDEFNQLLLKWELTDVDKQNIARPTGWGLLLFGKTPTDKYPQARIKFTVLTEKGAEPKTQDFIGPLVTIPPRIEEYLGFIFPKILDRSHFEHQEISEISIQLLREVIVNAIVHRDYAIAEAQILIEITPKNIIVKSPGMPIVAIEKLQNFTAPTVSRNPKLADVFYNMKYIERRGIGMEEVKKYQPKPVYSINEVYTVLTITRNVKLSAEEKQSLINSLSEKEKSVYNCFKESDVKLSKTEIAEKLNIEDKTVQRILKRLNDVGLIAVEGKGKATKYHIS
ncbi:HTH domain-containing protein [Bacteroidales bacterium OttesenSCG-928-C19]|nr:HTH domain-containing protein [Bacteroidales bacterium OttesenSCG-928-C19]